MHRLGKSAGLTAALLLGSCGNFAVNEASRSASSTTTRASHASSTQPATTEVTTTEGTTDDFPLNIAFSDEDCSRFETLMEGQTFQDTMRSHPHGEFEPIAEFIKAAEAIGDAAKDRFDVIREAAESGVPIPPAEPEEVGIARTDRMLQALSNPTLPVVSTNLTARIEADCGRTEFGDFLERLHDEAMFIQTAPPAGYCESLAIFGSETLPEIRSLAPDAHQSWIDAVEANAPRSFLIEGVKAEQYRRVQCA